MLHGMEDKGLFLLAFSHHYSFQLIHNLIVSGMPISALMHPCEEEKMIAETC